MASYAPENPISNPRLSPWKCPDGRLGRKKMEQAQRSAQEEIIEILDKI